MAALTLYPDDHLPFLAKGVPVVHLIPVPFPSVWHKMTVGILQALCTELMSLKQDDRTALDYPTMRAWSNIVRLVTAEYLQLGPAPTAPLTKDELVSFVF